MPNLPISGLPPSPANRVPTLDDLVAIVQSGFTDRSNLRLIKNLFDNIEIQDAPSGYSVTDSDRAKLVLSSAPGINPINMPEAAVVGAGWYTTLKANNFGITLNPAVGDNIEGVPSGDYYEIPPHGAKTFLSDGVKTYYVINDGENRTAKAVSYLSQAVDFDLAPYFTVADISTTTPGIVASLDVVGGYENDRFVAGDPALINNVGSNDFILATDDLTPITTVAAGKTVILMCLTVPTTPGNGTWRTVQLNDTGVPLFTYRSMVYANVVGELAEDVGFLSYNNKNHQMVLGGDPDSTFSQLLERVRTVTSDPEVGFHHHLLHFRGAGSSAPSIRMMTSGGTEAAPVITPSNSVLGNLTWAAYDGALTKIGASIRNQLSGAVDPVHGAVSDLVFTRTAQGDVGNDTTALSLLSNKVNKSHQPFLMADSSANTTVSFSFEGFADQKSQFMSSNTGGQDFNYVSWAPASQGTINMMLTSNGTYNAPTETTTGDTVGYVFAGYSEAGAANTYFPMVTIDVESTGSATSTGIPGSYTVTASKADGNTTTFFTLDGEGEVLQSSVGVMIDNSAASLEADSVFSANNLIGGTYGTIPYTRLTTAQRTGIASPTEALMTWDTNLKAPFVYDGTSWKSLLDAADAVDLTSAQTITGEKTFTATLHAQRGFTDALTVGADFGATTLTDATNKGGGIALPHYTNAEEKVSAISFDSQSGSNVVQVGGGTATENAATKTSLFAAPNNTTLTGQEMYSVNGPLNEHNWYNVGGTPLLLLGPAGNFISQIANYETLVTNDNSFTNKKYVDDLVNKTKEITISPVQWFQLGASPGQGSVGNAENHLDFDNDKQVYTNIILPSDYTAASDITAEIYWSPKDAGTGNVIWLLQNESVAVGSSVGGAGLSPTVTSAAPGVINQLVKADITISGTGLAPGELLSLRLYRDPTGNTYGDRAFLQAVRLKYT